MVTLESSNFYTGHAIKSFFKNTLLDSSDEFFLINNDKCKIDEYLFYDKIKIIDNQQPKSFAQNVNQIIKLAIQKKKDLIFLNNDILFVEGWLTPLLENKENISIPVNNQLFSYNSDCGTLKLKPTMNFEDYNENYKLLVEIIKKHKKKFKPGQLFQTLLMPFFCFKIPLKILSELGYFDEIFVCGGEDIDYRIRAALKGYEVNFLIDSYLLHFHGKSTWDGKETLEETESRNKIYTEAFLKKWGNELTRIFILKNDFENILLKKDLYELFKKNKFGDLIRKLK